MHVIDFRPFIGKSRWISNCFDKKILNKIKISDDGLALSAVTQSSQAENASLNKAALQNLYIFNKVKFRKKNIFLN